MSNPYIVTEEWFDHYRERQADYDYRSTHDWPEGCPIWKTLAPGDDMPHREWADHQVTEMTSNPCELPVYVCHPYELSIDAMKDLLMLERAGFTISVAGNSEYYPETMRVAIHPAGKHFNDIPGGLDHFDARGNPVPIEE